MGTIEGDKETGEKRLEELNQGAATEELVGVMYVTLQFFFLSLYHIRVLFSVLVRLLKIKLNFHQAQRMH